MRGEHKFLCSFCSSCVLRETSIGVDYTDFEEERLREKKGKMFPHHLRPTTEREKKYCVRNKNETVFKF
jgi:hypothetical protein